MLPGAERIFSLLVKAGQCWKALYCLGEELRQCYATSSDIFLLVFQLEVHITCEGNKIFQTELDLWGVRSCFTLIPIPVLCVRLGCNGARQPVLWGNHLQPKTQAHRRENRSL